MRRSYRSNYIPDMSAGQSDFESMRIAQLLIKQHVCCRGWLFGFALVNNIFQNYDPERYLFQQQIK